MNRYRAWIKSKEEKEARSDYLFLAPDDDNAIVYAFGLAFKDCWCKDDVIIEVYNQSTEKVVYYAEF